VILLTAFIGALLNRMRGGLFSVPTFLVAIPFGLLAYYISGLWYIGIAGYVLYLAGESDGWGKWLGSLCYRVDSMSAKTEKEGIFGWIDGVCSKVFPDYLTDNEAWFNYCRLALTLRGFQWWIGYVLLLSWFMPIAIFAIIPLSIGFTIATELTRDWARQEWCYGAIQGAILGSLLV
jgi:hypothetical protein